MNSFIVASDSLYAFFSEYGCIKWCKEVDKGWTQPQVLINYVKDNFSANLVGENIFINCLDNSGKMLKAKFEESGSLFEAINNSYIESIFPKDVFYPVNICNEKEHYLIIKREGNSLNYKEIYKNQSGIFKPLHSCSAFCSYIDCSFVATQKEIHSSLILHDFFGCKLVYHYVGNFKAEINLLQGLGPIYKSCILIAEEIAYITFLTNEGLFKIEININDVRNRETTKNISAKPIKIDDIHHLEKTYFIANNHKNIFASEMFSLKSRPWEILCTSKNYLKKFIASKKEAITNKPSKIRHDEFFANMELELNTIEIREQK